MSEKGYYDDDFAFEVAGNIIAIQESEELTNEEKKELLSGYDFKQDTETILNTTNELTDEKIAELEEAEKRRIEEEKRLKEEQRRREEEERKRKEKEERDNAIATLSSTIVNGFAFDETNLPEQQNDNLDNAISILNKYNDLNIVITGHTCKIGYKNINYRKGLKRAEAAKNYLISNGIAEERITIDSQGETNPVSDKKAENRRIELKINE